MSWVFVTDTAYDDPVLLSLDRGVRHLHFEALAYSNRQNTGGFIPRHALTRITDEPDSLVAAGILVEAGLWEEVERGWKVVWLLNDQREADEVQAYRDRQNLRTRRSRRHRAGDHSECSDPRWCDAIKASHQGDHALCSDPRHCPQLAAYETRDTTRDDTRVTRTPDQTRPDLMSGSGIRTRRGRGAGPAPRGPDGELLLLAIPEEFVTCVRCGVDLDLNEAEWVKGYPDDFMLCPLCFSTGKNRTEAEQGMCYAFKKPGGKDDTPPGTPCGNRSGDKPWCQYHLTPNKRGINPMPSLLALQPARRERDREMAAAEEKNP